MRCGAADAGAGAAHQPSEFDEERARGVARRFGTAGEDRAGGAFGAFDAAGAFGGRLDVARGGLGLRVERRDALVEPRRARFEVAPAFAGVVAEQPLAAIEQPGESEGPPQDDQQRQRADHVQRVAERDQPIAMRGEPVGDRREEGGERAQAVARLRRARLVDGEGEREGDDGGDQPGDLAAIGPDRAHGDAGARRRPGAVETAHQVAEAGGRVAAGEVEAAQARFDRAAIGADESVDARARRLVEQRVGQARALGLDIVARRAFALQPPRQLVMALGAAAAARNGSAPALAASSASAA